MSRRYCIPGHEMHAPYFARPAPRRGSATASHVEHARRRSSPGPRPAACRRGHGDTEQLLGGVDALDEIARPRRRRVALGRRRRSRRRQPGTGYRSRATCRCALQAARSRWREQEHGLRLGVAEAHVELEDLEPFRREHQPRVEHAAVRDVALRGRAGRPHGTPITSATTSGPATGTGECAPSLRCWGRGLRRRCA